MTDNFFKDHCFVYRQWSFCRIVYQTSTKGLRMKILFMCVANAARSQMAEGLAKAMLTKNDDIQSAGSKPKKVHPLAIKVLQELDIVITNHHSKSCDNLPTDFCNHVDYVITLCAEEVCPVGVFPKAQRLHWPLKDPASDQMSEQEQLTAFRFTRDEIKKRLQEFIKDKS